MMSADIYHLADHRPCRINPTPPPPQPSPPAAAAQPPAPPEHVSAEAGGDIDGWGLPDDVAFDRHGLAQPGEPRLLTIGDKVIFDRGRSRITEGVITHFDCRRATVHVLMTDGPDKGHRVVIASHKAHLIDTGSAQRVETAS